MEDVGLLGTLSPATQTLNLFELNDSSGSANYKQSIHLPLTGSTSNTKFEAFFNATASQLYLVSNRDLNVTRVTFNPADGTLADISSIRCSNLNNAPSGFQDIIYDSNGQLMVVTATSQELLAVEVPTVRSQVAPWIVANDGFESLISFFNEGSEHIDFQLTAYTNTGDVATTEMGVAGFTVNAFSASELFPELTGYALYVTSESTDLHTSFLTFSKSEEGGATSPSQTTAITDAAYARHISFGYFPTEWIGAIVVAAPNATSSASTNAQVVIRGADGNLIGEIDITLNGKAPLATTLDSLMPGVAFPEVVSVTIESEKELAGISFVFNEARQPSMAKAVPVP
jgi:hypothetical protein